MSKTETYRIKPGVRPYGGKIFKADRVEADMVGGFVHLSASRVATARRYYRSDELLPSGEQLEPQKD